MNLIEAATIVGEDLLSRHCDTILDGLLWEDFPESTEEDFNAIKNAAGLVLEEMLQDSDTLWRAEQFFRERVDYDAV